MTDTFDDGDDQRMATLPRKAVRKLEKDAAAGKEAMKKLADLETRQAFLEAGVKTDHPAATYFMRGYEGERTPEAIKAEWEKIAGSVPSGQQQQQDPSINGELDALNQGSALINQDPGQQTDRLHERNAKLSELSPTDPHYTEKFDAIAREYGTVYGNMTG